MHPKCGTKAGHDDHRRKYKDEFCEPCIEAMRQYWKDYRKRPEKKIRMREYARTNRKIRNGTRFKKLLAQGFNPAKDYFSANMVIETYGTDCHLCGGAIDLAAPRSPGAVGWEKSLHIDHVIPLSRGGDDTLDNVRPAHGQCNVKKHNRIIEDVATE
jgi:5-methylcytosine-specific restriction endonuclease McrA